MFDESSEKIAGYDFAQSESAVSPLSEGEIRQLEATVGWTEADEAALNTSAPLFCMKAEEMVDSWRAIIAAQPHLAKWFFGPDGKPDDDYKNRVKRRFVQWVIDVATRPHDLDWRNYQEEIGLRHTPAKKNATDQKQTPPLVPLRYLLGFIPVVLPIERFFIDIEDQGRRNAIQTAWTKAVVLHVTLWTRAYCAPGLW